MKAALEYLDLVPGEPTTDVAELRERIYNSGAPGVSEAAAQPPFPFIAETVSVAVPTPAAAAHAAQTAHAHAPGATASVNCLVTLLAGATSCVRLRGEGAWTDAVVHLWLNCSLESTIPLFKGMGLVRLYGVTLAKSLACLYVVSRVRVVQREGPE